MLRFLICEDNDVYLKLLASWVNDLLKELDIEGTVVVATANPHLLAEHIPTGPGNVYFLDIDLKSSMTGIELANAIRIANPLAYIVFITDYQDYVFQSFHTRPFDFLPKPVAWNKLKQCLIDLHKHYSHAYLSSEQSEPYIDIQFSSSVHRIKKSDIVFIEKFRNQSVIHTVNGRITCYETLGYFENHLMEDHSPFVRCHKSFIANKNHILEVQFHKQEILFRTGDRCGIGRKYKPDLR